MSKCNFSQVIFIGIDTILVWDHLSDYFWLLAVTAIMLWNDLLEVPVWISLKLANLLYHLLCSLWNGICMLPFLTYHAKCWTIGAKSLYKLVQNRSLWSKVVLFLRPLSGVMMGKTRVAKLAPKICSVCFLHWPSLLPALFPTASQQLRPLSVPSVYGHTHAVLLGRYCLEQEGKMLQWRVY